MRFLKKSILRILCLIMACITVACSSKPKQQEPVSENSNASETAGEVKEIRFS